MISRLVPEILPCDDFCDGVVGGAGLGYSNRLMNTASCVLLTTNEMVLRKMYSINGTSDILIIIWWK